jgi:translation initiation factor 4G
LKEEEERRLKLKLEEEHIQKAKQEEEKALRPAQERAKEEKERKEKEEQEAQERLSKLAEETQLRLEEVAAAEAKVKAISKPEPEKRELEAHKGDGKQDGQLEDGKDVNTKTSKTLEDGMDKPKDGLRIDTASISSPTANKRRPGPLDLSIVHLLLSPLLLLLVSLPISQQFHILRVSRARIQTLTKT